MFQPFNFVCTVRAYSLIYYITCWCVILGQHNLICVEDLINEIFTVGPHFKEATNFLWPFQFSPSKQRYYKSERASIGDGQFGFRGTKVNDFIEKWI